MSWACLVFFVAMLALLALEDDTRKALFFVPVWFVILGLAYRSMRQKKSQGVQLSYDAD
ncbi:D-serine/D-alanine/glycine transporter [compost metagenome]